MTNIVSNERKAFNNYFTSQLRSIKKSNVATMLAVVSKTMEALARAQNNPSTQLNLAGKKIAVKNLKPNDIQVFVKFARKVLSTHPLTELQGDSLILNLEKVRNKYIPQWLRDTSKRFIRGGKIYIPPDEYSVSNELNKLKLDIWMNEKIMTDSNAPEEGLKAAENALSKTIIQTQKEAKQAQIRLSNQTRHIRLAGIPLVAASGVAFGVMLFGAIALTGGLAAALVITITGFSTQIMCPASSMKSNSILER